MEVNEASLLIQEAAHEDANIIFGAVVDPKLDGRVKVTVIATGFDAVSPIVRRRSSASQTPVDLQHYTAHLKEKVESVRPAWIWAVCRLREGRRWISRQRHAGAGGLHAAGRAATAMPDDIDLDALSAFDVPAFLRREG